MKKKINSKISEHFRKLGQKSWKARQKRLLEGAVDKSLANERTKV